VAQARDDAGRGMSDDRWRRIEELYHAALGLPLEQRAAFLEDASGGDSGLRREVESLLAQHDSKDTVFDQRAWTNLGPNDESASRSEALLDSGAVLGPYRITGLLGAGGMGQVYRAHDSRLHRSVAIKVFFPGQDARRFNREARAVAALSHANVVPIFDVGHDNGVDYLVEELVEGEPLREVLRRGRLDVARFQHLAVQIAEGLAAAHRAGITHRDLKPGNIMVSREDCARILDFGLAISNRAGSDEATSSSRQGAVGGTAAYMSPEQALGGKTDARSDIFSYGALLYEMITGRQAFARDTLTATLAAVLEADPPPVGEIVAGLPDKLSQIIQKCLNKDRRGRYQAIDDVRLALGDLENDTDLAIVVLNRPEPAMAKGHLIRFGVFEVNLQTGELRKHGLRIKLREQPFQILSLLLEHPGHVVTRQELQKKLWAADTFVDFDRGLNRAVNQLRDALSDSAENSRFIETFPKRGYRFIAPVEGPSDAEGPATTAAPAAPAPEPETLPTTAGHSRARIWLPAAAALMLIALAAVWFYARTAHAPTEPNTVVLAEFDNRTGDPAFDYALKQALKIDLQQSPFLKDPVRPANSGYTPADGPPSR
jgi:serine/threonine protein kinase